MLISTITLALQTGCWHALVSPQLGMQLPLGKAWCCERVAGCSLGESRKAHWGALSRWVFCRVPPNFKLELLESSWGVAWLWPQCCCDPTAPVCSASLPGPPWHCPVSILNYFQRSACRRADWASSKFFPWGTGVYFDLWETWPRTW